MDVARATEGMDPEQTLVVIISKTFTTAETMLNARTLRKWLVDSLLQSDSAEVSQWPRRVLKQLWSIALLSGCGQAHDCCQRRHSQGKGVWH